MAKGLITKSHLSDIASAIREKLDAQTTYKPGQMAAAIESIETPNLEALSATANGTYTPTSPKNGFSSVQVNVPAPQPTLQSKTVTPSASDQTVIPDSGYDGLSSVVVEGDSDLIAGNIKKDVEIFGVTGSYEGGGSATLITKNITQNGTYNASSDNADGYSQVTVNVSGGTASSNDFLFHFEDYHNSGKTGAVFANNTGLSISTEQSKFGSKSLKTGNSQTIDNVYFDIGFILGTNDFTLDFWCYPTNLPSSSTYVVPISFDYRSLAIYINQEAIQFGIAKENSSWFNIATNNVQISNNVWNHIALVRDGTNVYGFLNGVKIITVDFGSDSWATISKMTVGSNTYRAGDRRFAGYIDELRLKIGSAEWTSDFTPPTQPYT